MEPLCILDPEGGLHGEPPLSDEQTLEALRLMLLSRAFDERAIKLQRLGRLGTYGRVHGQEASVVGSATALDPSRDWIAPAYREQPAMLRPGLALERLPSGDTGGHTPAPGRLHGPHHLGSHPRRLTAAAPQPGGRGPAAARRRAGLGPQAAQAGR